MTDRIIRLPELQELIGLSRSGIYSAMSCGQLPKSVKLSKRAVGWRLSTIEAWLETREVSTSDNIEG